MPHADHRRGPSATATLAILTLLLAGAAAPARAGGPSADEVIVRFADGAGPAQRSAARAAARASVVRALPVPGMQLVRVPDGAGRSAAIERLEREPGVLYAEPNVARRATAVNDPYFGLLWGLDNTGQSVAGSAGLAGADIDAPGAWALTSGSQQVTVAVIDSGVATDHPDLRTQMWTNAGEVAGNGLDDDRNGYVDDAAGWDWVTGDATPLDLNGHGTHVAGTIAARGNDATGVIGVAPSARLMALRVLDADGSGDVAGVISAYGYAASARARVVNLSLGGQSPSRAERDALAAAPGVLFVIAAGNGGDDGVGDDNDSTAQYPCNYKLANIVCVAASDSRDELAAFSNFGASTVDLAAPGVDILSDQPPSATGKPRYAYYDGTSMATPHVAGAAALAFSLRPDADVATVRSALLDGADPRAAFAGRTSTGGRLNARRTLELLAATAPAEAPAPSPNPTAAPSPDPAAAPSPDPAAAPEPDPTAAPEPDPAAAPQPDATAPPQPDPVAPADAPAAPVALPALALLPAPSLAAPARQPLTRVRRSGLRALVVCPGGCLATATLRLSARDARRTRLAAASRSVRIGAARRQVAGAAQQRLTVRLSAAARRALRGVRRPLRVRLVVRLGVSTLTRTITLTPSRR